MDLHNHVHRQAGQTLYKQSRPEVERVSSAALSWIFHGSRHSRVVQPSGVTNNSPALVQRQVRKPASQRSEVRNQQRRRQARATLPLRLNGSHLQAASNPQMCGTRAASSSSFFSIGHHGSVYTVRYRSRVTLAAGIM